VALFGDQILSANFPFTFEVQLGSLGERQRRLATFGQVEPAVPGILPNDRMNRENAARYLDRKPKTLAMWATEGKGPPAHKAGGRVFYFKKDLDEFLGIEAAA
jgi:hypothetical protein